VAVAVAVDRWLRGSVAVAVDMVAGWLRGSDSGGWMAVAVAVDRWLRGSGSGSVSTVSACQTVAAVSTVSTSPQWQCDSVTMAVAAWQWQQWQHDSGSMTVAVMAAMAVAAMAAV
jgi:hypothetical protein